MEYVQFLEKIGFTFGGAIFLVAAISFTFFYIKIHVKEINEKIDNEAKILNLKIESAISGHKNLCDKASKSDVSEIKSMLNSISLRIDDLFSKLSEK